MRNSFKLLVRRAIRRAGYDFHRIIPGRDPYHDMQLFTQGKRQPVVFDVGANTGQTIGEFRSFFPESIIHSFEPGKVAFAELYRNYGKLSATHLNNFALGANIGTLKFNEYSNSYMSSFLETEPAVQETIVYRSKVELATVDSYCTERSIFSIDVLKSDTQGLDLEVIRGAEHLLKNNRIHLIYVEVNFSNMYKGQARLDEIYRFMIELGFELASFYEIYYRNNLASWTDALIINQKFQRQ